jgi:hypothetical protein
MAFAMMGDTERAWERFALLKPVHHGSTADAIERYKVEPYVMCADTYAVSPHTGRGGWTWYTGAAGWMYRLICKRCWGCTWKWTICALRRASRPTGRRTQSTAAIARPSTTSTSSGSRGKRGKAIRVTVDGEAVDG